MSRDALAEFWATAPTGHELLIETVRSCRSLPVSHSCSNTTHTRSRSRGCISCRSTPGVPGVLTLGSTHQTRALQLA